MRIARAPVRCELPVIAWRYSEEPRITKGNLEGGVPLECVRSAADASASEIKNRRFALLLKRLFFTLAA